MIRVAILFGALLINSAYLAASASPTLFYFSNILIHIALGLALAIVYLRPWGFSALVTQRFLTAVASAKVSPALRQLTWLLLMAAAISGTALIFLGATTPNLWLLRGHIATSVAGTALLLATVVWPAARARTAQVQAAVAIGIMVIVLASAIAVAFAYRHEETRRQTYRIVNPNVVPATMNEEGAGPTSPFFPSSANTTVNATIPANFFLTSESCARCHREIYDQWNSSMHHFSSFNNQWYRKSIEYMQDVVGTQPSKWCAGCHDHAVFFNGRFDRPIREQIDTPEAQAGLGCTSCHAITRVKSTMGQGDFTIEYPPMHDLAASGNRILRATHDYLLKLDPQPHRETFLKPFHREQTAEFCSSCHKVHLDVPVNDYRWFRGFNEYDNWQASGVSGQGARSFYYPPAPQKCADCHMPLIASNDPAAKNGKVRSHRFPGANTAVPYVNGDAEQLRMTQAFLKDGQISVDVFGLVRGGEDETRDTRQAAAADPAIASTFAVGEESMHLGAQQVFVGAPREVVAPLDRVTPVVR